MNNTEHEKRVQEFFNYDAGKYSKDRYPEKPQSCDQYSYLTRKQYVLSVLDSRIEVSANVLDIGCGPGIYTRDLLERGWNTYGIDISPKMIEKAQDTVKDWSGDNHVEFTTGLVTDLPYPASKFDAIICIGVVSYIDDLHKALKEVNRVLKPGGYVIFQISNKLSPFEIGTTIRNKLRPLVNMVKTKDKDDELVEKFRLRAYRVKYFVKACEVAGFDNEDVYYYDFRFPIFAKIFHGFSLAIGKRLQSTIPYSKYLGWLGACALTVMRKQ